MFAAVPSYAQGLKAQRFRGIQLIGPTTKNNANEKNQGVALLAPPGVTTSYALIFPSSRGNVGQSLSISTVDGSNAAFLGWTTSLTLESGWALEGNLLVDSTNFWLGTKSSTTADWPLIVKTDGNERMRILGGSGYVGIGTPSPTAQLQINPSTATTVGLQLKMASNTTANAFEIHDNNSRDLFTIGPTGAVSLRPSGNSAGSTNELRFLELSAGGTNYIGFKAPDAIGSNVIWTLPAADGTNGQAVTTNGSGVLGWTSVLSPTTGWSLQGNGGASSTGALGATPTGSRLGTTDANDLRIVTQNTVRMIVGSAGDITMGGTLGVSGATTLSSTLGVTGLITGSAGATISGAITNINANSNFATNINTGTSAGATTIGNTGSTVTIGSIATSLKSNVGTNDRIVLANTSGRLDQASIASVITAGIGGTPWITAGNSTSDAWNGTSGSRIGTTSAQPLVLATTNSTAQDIRIFTGPSGANERMRITGAGRVGILEVAPKSSLQVNAATQGSIGLIVKASDQLDGLVPPELPGVPPGGTNGNLFELRSAADSILFFASNSGTLVLRPYGTASGQTNEIRFRELLANGSNDVGFKAPNSISTDVMWTLPASDGSSGQALTTDGVGVLGWSSVLTPTSGWQLSGNSTTDAWNGTSGARLGTTSAQPLVIATTNATSQDIRFVTGANGSSERMRILGTGFIGIGTTTPSAQLDIQTAAISFPGLIIRGQAGQTANLFMARNGSGQNLVSINPAGAIVLEPVSASAGGTNSIRFTELAANGTHYVGFKAPDAIAANRLWTLPDADGTSGQVLSTDGSGTLSWLTPLTSATAVTTFSAGTTGLTPTTATSGAVVLAGTLDVDNGGTGRTFVTAYMPIVGGTTSTGTMQSVATGSTTGQPLLYQGASAVPAFGALNLAGGSTIVTGVLPVANGGTGSSTQNFVDLTTAQTVAGQKTWSDLATFTGGTTVTGTTQINVSGTSATTIGNTSSSTAVTINSGSTGGLTLGGIPSGSASDDVLLINASNKVTKTTRADLISAAGWALTGNATTTAWNGTSGSRLGTTSAQPLVLATTNATAQDIQFYTGANGASERMRILGNGRIGIGITNPTAAFEVQASGGGDEVFNFKRSSGSTVLKSDILGRVMINTTDAGGWLTVKGSGGNGGNLQLQSMTDVKWEVTSGNTSGPHGTAGFSIWGNVSNVSGSGTLRLGIDTNGRTGIGTHTTYDAMLDVRNNVAASNVLNLRGASGQSANFVTIENNAGLDLITVKSTGALSLEPTGSSSGNTNELRFAELAANGTNYVGLKAPDAITANTIWTLPNADGTSGQVLTTNGSGALSWASALTSASGWSLTGNATTDSTTNYIGTTDEAVGRPLVVRTDGTERMRVLGGSGFVGIGTSTPTAQVQVVPSGATTIGLNVRATSGQTANLVTIGSSTGSNLIQIGPTGNLNIGPFLAETGTLDEPLRVSTRVQASSTTERDLFVGQMEHSGLVPAFRLGLSNYAPLDFSNARTQLNFKLRNGSNSIFQTTTVMTLRSEGLVGINTAAPATALDVTGTSTFRPASTGSALSIRQASGQSASLIDVVSSAGSSLLTVGSSGAMTLLPFGTSAGNTNELRFTELAAGGTNYVGFKAPDAIAADRIWTLPSADGTSGQILSTNGSGVLSWTSALTSTSGWGTTGNSGLNASSNFLGTIDSVDVVFRHTNSERMRMTRNGLRVVQNGTPVASQWVASFQNIGNPTYLELLNSSEGGGMYMGMRGNGSIGDTATLWNWQAGPLVFYTGTTNKASMARMFISSDGNVTIGNHSTQFTPAAKLHIRGGNLLIDTVGTASGQLLFRNQLGTANTSIRAGNQTSDISYWLPATAPSANGQILTSNTAGVMSWADMSSQGWTLTGNAGTSALTNFIGTTDPVDLVLRRDNTERARLTSAGLRVLQNGTPRSSVWTLSVQNISGTNSSTVVEFLNTTAAVDGGGGFVGLRGNGAIGDTLGLWNHQGGPILFMTGTTNRNNVQRMMVGSNGNVGIGEITAGTLLDVDGGVTVRPGTTVNVIADNQAVTIGNRSHVVLSSNGTPANRTITISNGLQTGQLLFIMVTGTAATNGIELADDPTGSNTNLSGLAQLVDGAVLQLIWNGADWMEVTRSNN
jgi:hypothetical protein